MFTTRYSCKQIQGQTVYNIAVIIYCIMIYNDTHEQFSVLMHMCKSFTGGFKTVCQCVQVELEDLFLTLKNNILTASQKRFTY